MTKLGEGVEVRAHTLPNDGPPHEPGLIPVALHQALQVDGDIVRPGQLAVLLPPPIHTVSSNLIGTYFYVISSWKPLI